MTIKTELRHRVDHTRTAACEYHEPVTECFYCGIRSDLGCSHNMNEAYFALRDKEVANEVWDRTVRAARMDAGYHDLTVLTGPGAAAAYGPGWSDVNPEPKR